MIVYRDARPDDGKALATMARTAFTETFGTLYKPADLAAFLDEAFGPDGLPAQIGDPAFTIRVATRGEAIIGFAKIGPVAFPATGPNGRSSSINSTCCPAIWGRGSARR